MRFSILFTGALLSCAACCLSCNVSPETVKSKPAKPTTNLRPANLTPAINDSGYTPVDRSPMDMAYFPADYPTSKMNGTSSGAPLARLIYSRPQKNGRTIFGNTEKNPCPYGKEWRLGANEATEIEFFKPVRIQDKKIAAGRYILYCIPYPDKWTIVLNSELFTWGLHIDTSKDIARFEIPVTAISNPVEVFTMEFLPAGRDAGLLMAWDHSKTELPISF